MKPKGNLVLNTDSYKLAHWQQYPEDTEGVYSYWESRDGARYRTTTFFGLQYLVKRYLEGAAVNEADAEEAFELARHHFGDASLFNYQGWLDLINRHEGRLPVRIKAVPEGMAVPVGNVMMTIENTDPAFYWLPNYLETLLCRLWYPTNVATLSGAVIDRIGVYLEETTGSREGLEFMLHDFGSRGATTAEAAALGGAAHLIHSRGTDTLQGMELAHDYYGASYENLAFSVPATEHSVMTARGRDGEAEVVDQLLDAYPKGILSIVADSYDTRAFVRMLADKFKDRILARDGKVVVRPDSGSPMGETVKVLDMLRESFGTTTNDKGYDVLDPHVGALWGDGIDADGIDKILYAMQRANFAASNIVFGMGGGLLQKHNRDTQRDAFKASSIKRGGVWHPIYKDPTNGHKPSKAGRLALIRNGAGVTTISSDDTFVGDNDLLETVFENGVLLREQTFDQVRAVATVSAADNLRAQVEAIA